MGDGSYSSQYVEYNQMTSTDNIMWEYEYTYGIDGQLKGHLDKMDEEEQLDTFERNQLF